MGFQLFVCACDKYQWIYDDFIRLAQKNCPWEISFFTETATGPGLIPLGKLAWRERMLMALSSVRSQDVIYLQEDFLILNVNKPIIEDVYDFHVRKNACITKLGNNHEFQYNKIPYKIGPYQVYLQSLADEYLMSHQPVAIFNRNFLIDSLTEEMTNPSIHEISGSKWMRLYNNTRVYCLGEPTFPKNSSGIFHFEHAIRQGEVLPDAMQYLSLT